MMASLRLPLTSKSKRSAIRTVPKHDAKRPVNIRSFLPRTGEAGRDDHLCDRPLLLPQGWQPRELTRGELQPEPMRPRLLRAAMSRGRTAGPYIAQVR
jgi:hypothetical protein